MWNDTDTPLAFFISFRCYGTWLHGDERGSIDRHNNSYASAKYPKIEHWNQISSKRLKYEPVKLDSGRRVSVENAIRETCIKRNWQLLAINVRTNHVHTVAAIGSKKASSALNAFKANASRQMREDGFWNAVYTPWADKGSERYLCIEKHIFNAIDYVLNGQGDDLLSFDNRN